MSPRHKYVFEIVLQIAGTEDEFLDEIADALIEAGCDDATFSVRYRVPRAEFRRAAPNFARAVLSALADLESVPGVEVERIELEELVTATEIGERLQRTRQNIQQLISGRRGPGGFPQPADWVYGAKLWSWPKVASWLGWTRRKAEVSSSPDEVEFAGALNGLLKTRRHIQRLEDQEEREVIRRFLYWEVAEIQRRREPRDVWSDDRELANLAMRDS